MADGWVCVLLLGVLKRMSWWGVCWLHRDLARS